MTETTGRSPQVRALETTFEVVAHNFAVDSENKIHDDEVAATYGFRGGLVPGVGVLGYMSRAVVERWGRRWLESGGLTAKFLRPVYDGHSVRAVAKTSGEGESLQLEVHDFEGQLCAVGSASLSPELEPPSLDGFPRAELPAERLPPDSSRIPVGSAVGSLDVAELARVSTAAVADRYRDDHSLYTGVGAFLHPAFLPDQANTVLSSNVALGPWIHTQSRMQFHEALVPYESMELRGKYAAAYAKRGHEIVELDLVLVCEGRVAATIHHTAIVRPRAGAGS